MNIIDSLVASYRESENVIEWAKYYYGRCQEVFNEHRAVASIKKNANRDDAVFLLGTPFHCNLGDHAIALAELEFFARLGYYVVEIPSQLVDKYLDTWKDLIGRKRIYVHGGGFVGSLWPEEEEMMERIIESFPQNEIVILPQTVYFDNVDARVTHLNELLGKHGNVVLCARESYSYRFACQHLHRAKVILVPDMVLSANWFDHAPAAKNNVVFCMRRDLEKTISEATVEKLQALVSRYYPNAKVMFTDTVGKDMIYPHMRKRKLKKKLAVFASAKLVITDRLHGMVLSAMTNTPTLVFSNCNYKVKGIYDWISNNSFLSYCDDEANMEEKLAQLVKEENCRYCRDEAAKAFEPLIEIAGNYHG